MIVLALSLLGAGLVAGISIWIIVRENGRDARETEEAITRRLELGLENELAGAPEGRWPQ